MIRYFVLAALLLASAAGALAQHAQGSPLAPQVSQSAASFARAVQEMSSAPHYVRVVVRGSADPTGVVSCVAGWDLNVAIRREYSLPSTAEGMQKASEIAIARTDRTFLFTNAAALALVMPTFSDQDLSEAPAGLASLSEQELRAGFSLSPWGHLHEHYRNRKQRDAAACVLIERGMSPGIDDRSRAVYIDQ